MISSALFFVACVRDFRVGDGAPYGVGCVDCNKLRKLKRAGRAGPRPLHGVGDYPQLRRSLSRGRQIAAPTHHSTLNTYHSHRKAVRCAPSRGKRDFGNYINYLWKL